jgi:hypothetical protein
MGSRISHRAVAAALSLITTGATALILAAGSTTAQAAVWTDQPDYSPGSVVTFHGDNSDGAGYQAGETVHVAVNDPSGSTQSCDATADDSGAWSCQITLGPGVASVGLYDYTATGQASGVSQNGTFTDSACPASVGSRPTDPNVSASFTASGGTATYSITTPNESPSGGIPGLIEYCVYPSGGSLPASESATYVSPDGAWTAGTETAKGLLDFSRPGGDRSNLPFDGSSQQVGTATWSGSAPASQTILLHINDPNECAALGLGNTTCFVFPGNGAPANKNLRVTKTATPSFTRTYTWGIAKTVDQKEIDTPGNATFHYTVSVTHDGGTDSGWQVAGQITVTNPNSADFTGVNVTDSSDQGGNCAVAGGAGVTVPGDGSKVLDYTCSYSSAPASAVTDTATAAWDNAANNTPDGSATGTATADFATVTPTITDGSVSVTDTLGSSLGTVSYTGTSPKTFTYPITFSDPAGTCTTHGNTATFTTDDSGATGSASQSVKVCVGADLTVKKDATPSFTRTYNWKIVKSVNPAVLDAGGTAHYSVTVTETGFTDSNWQVTGNITVTNPNNWEAVSLTGVTDAIDNGGTCTITSGSTTQPIAAGGTATLGYTCRYGSAPSPASGTNTATATWGATAASTPDGSANGTATADFGSATPTTINGKITVTDTYKGTLGTVTATDTTPFATQTFTYDRKLAPPSSGCTTVNNTATIVETGQSSSASVNDCNTGALTMGYWQNKNGQALITGANQTALAAFLTGYSPFADYPQKAGQTVAAYVTTIIKAANASGASMNAMLKAQMLATSLDVYFSDPALGGNKIGATLPIGGVTIDLTSVCKMVDSSNGTGICGSGFENVSAAFGGATSLTVSQMLSYAASQSNAGGSVWYAQVKATQGLAKDVFDAINNQDASSP